MSVHLQSNQFKLLNRPAPVPDVGCCAKFAAFIIGSAAVGGLATAAFGGPIASSALAGTVGKVAEATGLVNGIKTGGNLLTQASGAYFGHTVSIQADTGYSLNQCGSMFESLTCFKYSALGVVGFAIIGLACWNVIKIMNRHTG